MTASGGSGDCIAVDHDQRCTGLYYSNSVQLSSNSPSLALFVLSLIAKRIAAAAFYRLLRGAFCVWLLADQFQHKE